MGNGGKDRHLLAVGYLNTTAAEIPTHTLIPLSNNILPTMHAIL